MAITLNFSTGQIDKGDTKTLSLTPKDTDDAAVTPSTVTATFTKPDGSTETKNKADFTNNSGTWSLQYTFDEAGPWEVDIKVTDASGNDERETDTVYVHP